MSRSRFQAISWNLHLCNLEEDRENAKKKGTPDYDRLFKIKPLCTDIIAACKTYFHPNRELAADERMLSLKARISFKQYMKDKPTKWGYKLFVLADVATHGTSSFMKVRLLWPQVKDWVMILWYASWICLFWAKATKGTCIWTTFIQAQAFRWTCWRKRCLCVARYAPTYRAFLEQEPMNSVKRRREDPYAGFVKVISSLWGGWTQKWFRCVRRFTRHMMALPSQGVSGIPRIYGKSAKSQLQQQLGTTINTYGVWTFQMPWLGTTMSYTRPKNGTRHFFPILSTLQWWTV